MSAGIAQDRLGVMIGLDESSSATRISRYEMGIHEPPFPVAEKLAQALDVPVAYFYCPDDELAEFIRKAAALGDEGRQRLNECLDGLLARDGHA